MNLSELRAYVRTQTQTTSGELPDSTVDAYLQEAFNRTMSMENRWPFFQKNWQNTLPAGETSFALPGDVNIPGITALRFGDDYSVELMDHVTAEELFGGDASAKARPIRWSIWEGRAHLWPAANYDTDTTWKLSGYRLPADWISQGTSAEPDCDPRLHLPLAHFAIARAYAQQEDEVLDEKSMRRWYEDAEVARHQIMMPPRSRPMIMGRRFITPIGRGGGGGARAIVDTTGI